MSTNTWILTRTHKQTGRVWVVGVRESSAQWMREMPWPLDGWNVVQDTPHAQHTRCVFYAEGPNTWQYDLVLCNDQTPSYLIGRPGPCFLRKY